GPLAALSRLGDRPCRDPYCDAPIRHLDHVHRHTDGGPSTLANGRGLYERGNYTREMPGWHATLTHDGLHGRPHTVTITTPTGHTYTRSAPQPTRPRRRRCKPRGQRRIAPRSIRAATGLLEGASSTTKVSGCAWTTPR